MRPEQEDNILEAKEYLGDFLEKEADGEEAPLLTPDQRVKLFEAVGVLEELEKRHLLGDHISW